MFYAVCFNVYSLLRQSICSLGVKKYKDNHISIHIVLLSLLFSILASFTKMFLFCCIVRAFSFGFLFIFDSPLRNWFMLNVFFSDREIVPLSQRKWNLKTGNIWKSHPKALWLVSMLNILRYLTAHSLTIRCNKLGLNGSCLVRSFSAAYQ